MSIDKITFMLDPSRSHPLVVVLPDNIEPEIVKEIFRDYFNEITLAITITKAPISFKAEQEKLTNPSVEKIFNAFKQVILSKYSNAFGHEEKSDDECKGAKPESSSYNSKFEEAKIHFQDTKKLTEIDIEFNVNF